MKTIKLFKLLVMGVLVIAISSCSSDDDGDDGNNSGADEHVTAKIDGSDWSASTDFDTTAATMASGGGSTILTVQGSDNDGKAINFSIMNYSGPATYTTGDNLANTNLIQYITVTPVAGWISNAVTASVGGLTPGSITITSDSDGVVEGTFSFDGYNGSDMSTKVITEGSFKANIE